MRNLRIFTFFISVIFFLSFNSSVMSDDIDKGFEYLKAGKYGKAISIFKPLASKGNILAQYQFGEMLRKGMGIHKNYRFAMAYFKKAANQGHAESSFMVGEMYQRGWGVNVDIDKAMMWWRKAAFIGSADAQLNLGTMYFKGKGVGQNFIQSYAWSAIASAQKYPAATTNRDRVALLMTKKEIIDAKGIAENYWEDYVKPFQTGAYFTRPKLKFD